MGIPMTLERIEHRACAGGWQDVYEHASTTLGCMMRFAVYLPPTGSPTVYVRYQPDGAHSRAEKVFGPEIYTF